VTDGGAVIATTDANVPPGPVAAAIRPEHLLPDDAGSIAGRVSVVENLGHYAYAFVETADGRLCVLLDRSRPVRSGDAMRLAARAGQVHLFDPATGLRRA
jgi:multiple sugar transport system ATP-binding protein